MADCTVVSFQPAATAAESLLVKVPMSYQVLARKWRPRNFDELVGQEHVVRALRNALDNDRVHHAFLFTGTRGVGKTTLARILAKSLNCELGPSSTPCGECGACQEVDQGRFVDLIEVDAASRAKVDQTRELMDNVQFAPSRGRHKVYLIDEVHMFSTASFNALLKTLEEPPPHVKFLLATTDPQKVPVTVLSRCLQFNLKRLPSRAIAGHLDAILEREGVERESGATSLVARAADGSMRDALSLLDQAIAYGGGNLVLEDVRAMLGAVDRQHVLHLLEGLANTDGEALMRTLRTLQDDGIDPDDALEELARVLQRVAVLQTVPGATSEDDELDTLASGFTGRLAPADVQLYYQIAIVARRDLTLAPDPVAGLEMALLRMLAFRPGAAGAKGSGGGGSGAPTDPRSGGTSRGDASEPASPRTTDQLSPVEQVRRAAGLGDGSPQRLAAVAEARSDRVRAEPLSSPARTTAGERVVQPQRNGAPGPSVPWEHPASAPAAPSGTPAVRPPAALPDSEEWAAWVADLGLGGLAGELLSHTEMVSSVDEVLSLRLSPEHAPLATDRLRADVSAELGQRLARPLRVEVKIDTVEAETAAQRRERLRAERQAAAVAAIAEDPGVQAICEAFNTRVDPSLVEPLD